MTKEERDKAIRILQWLHDNNFLFASTEEDVKYATKLAIQELEQEPCEDAISRTEVIKSIDEREDVNGKVDAESVRTDIVLMPSVKPQEPFKPMVEIDLYSVIKQKYIERDVLDKIRDEIDRQQKWLLQAGYATYNVDIALDAIKAVVAEKE